MRKPSQSACWRWMIMAAGIMIGVALSLRMYYGSLFALSFARCSGALSDQTFDRWLGPVAGPFFRPAQWYEASSLPGARAGRDYRLRLMIWAESLNEKRR